MEPRISIITLGVNDLPRSVEFYRDGLGFPLVDENTESIAFFRTEGTWLALYPRAALAADVGIDTEGSGFSGVTLAHNVRSREEVDACSRCSRRRCNLGETRRRCLLGRLLRLLFRPRRLPLGDRLESTLLDRVVGDI